MLFLPTIPNALKLARIHTLHAQRPDVPMRVLVNQVAKETHK